MGETHEQDAEWRTGGLEISVSSLLDGFEPVIPLCSKMQDRNKKKMVAHPAIQGTLVLSHVSLWGVRTGDPGWRGGLHGATGLSLMPSAWVVEAGSHL